MEEEERRARALLKSLGFREFILEPTKADLDGISWKCRLICAWGRTRNWGHSPWEAVLRVLAGNPIPLPLSKKRRAS